LNNPVRIIDAFVVLTLIEENIFKKNDVYNKEAK
jgi:hypothetical protein